MNENHSIKALTDKPFALDWNVTWGGGDNDMGYGVITTGSEVVIVGGTESFSVGDNDGFIAAYSITNNSQLWNATWGGSNEDRFWGVVYSPSKNSLYVVGDTYSFGGGGWDAVLAKYWINGTLDWIQQWGKSGGANDWGFDIALSPTEEAIYITGDTNSHGAGGYDAYIAKFTTNGVQIWNQTWGKGSADYGRGVSTNGSIVYLSGYHGTGSDFDAFLAAFDASNGNQLWNQTLGGNLTDFSRSVFTDGTQVYITGTSQTFGNFLAAFDASNGIQLWNSSDIKDGYKMTMNNSDLYVTGSFVNPLTSSIDAFIIRFNTTNGKQLQNWTYGGGDIEYGRGIGILNDSLYLTGYVNNTGAGLYDAFLVEYQIDTLSPSIILDYPKNNSICQKPILINLTILDSHLDENTFEWRANVTQTTWTSTHIGTFDINITDFVSDQAVQFCFRVNDTVGNQNTSSFVLIFDDTAPEIQLNVFSNQSVLQKPDILNLTLLDAHLNQTTFEWRANVVQTIWTSDHLGSFDINITEFPSDQTVQIWVRINDSANNQNVTSFILIFDDTPPTKPYNPDYAIESNKIILVWSPSTDLHSISYQVWYDTTYLGTTPLPYFVDNRSLQSGSHVYRIIPFDEAGNQGDALEIHIDVATSFNWALILAGLTIGLTTALGITLYFGKKRRSDTFCNLHIRKNISIKTL